MSCPWGNGERVVFFTVIQNSFYLRTRIRNLDSASWYTNQIDSTFPVRQINSSNYEALSSPVIGDDGYAYLVYVHKTNLDLRLACFDGTTWTDSQIAAASDWYSPTITKITGGWYVTCGDKVGTIYRLRLFVYSGVSWTEHSEMVDVTDYEMRNSGASAPFAETDKKYGIWSFASIHGQVFVNPPSSSISASPSTSISQSPSRSNSPSWSPSSSRSKSRSASSSSSKSRSISRSKSSSKSKSVSPSISPSPSIGPWPTAEESYPRLKVKVIHEPHNSSVFGIRIQSSFDPTSASSLLLYYMKPKSQLVYSLTAAIVSTRPYEFEAIVNVPPNDTAGKWLFRPYIAIRGRRFNCDAFFVNVQPPLAHVDQTE